MSDPIVVNVASGHYVQGQIRMMAKWPAPKPNFLTYCDALPPRSPKHRKKPYAFKALALQHAADAGAKQILWADACILAVRSLNPIWEIAATHGVWICRNGWNNYQWTADSAYPDLFPDVSTIEEARERNRNIPHVVATTFAIDLQHPRGRAFLAEYVRLAGETNAFCGPWINRTNQPNVNQSDRCYACGPVDVLGHRHDQTAASVIAHRLHIPLSDPPTFFAYAGGEVESTILVADGLY